ncbi:hypothetical protein D3C83_263870 [compost metagenome]
MAAVKPKITSGPSTSSETSVISSVGVVTTVRERVSFTDRSSSSGSGILRYFVRFSRTRS